MFQDALNALSFAYNNMESNHLSDDEQGARQSLIRLCKEIANTYDEDIVNEPDQEYDAATRKQIESDINWLRYKEMDREDAR